MHNTEVPFVLEEQEGLRVLQRAGCTGVEGSGLGCAHLSGGRPPERVMVGAEEVNNHLISAPGPGRKECRGLLGITKMTVLPLGFLNPSVVPAGASRAGGPILDTGPPSPGSPFPWMGCQCH